MRAVCFRGLDKKERRGESEPPHRVEKHRSLVRPNVWPQAPLVSCSERPATRQEHNKTGHLVAFLSPWAQELGSTPSEAEKMAEDSLLDYLESQVRAGVRSSGGRFTVRELQDVQLPFLRLPHPDWWSLKVIQGLVALGARRIRVDCGLRATDFHAAGCLPGLISQLERALSLDSSCASPAIEHLRLALLELATRGRAFRLREAGQPEGLQQAEGRLRGWRCGPGSELHLRVQHASTGEPRRRRIFFWQAPARREAVLSQLHSRAFFCPVPLTVNGSRMAPPGVTSRLAFGICSSQRGLLQVPWVRPGAGVSAACWIRQGRFSPSLLHWIQDGVVVDSHPLQVAPGICQCTLFAPADGLPGGPAGLQLTRGPSYQQRFQEVMRDLLPVLENLQLSPGLVSSHLEFSLRSSATRLHADLQQMLKA